MFCSLKQYAEYKCPHKIGNETIAESWQKCDFLEVVNDRIQLKCCYKYYAQITGEVPLQDTVLKCDAARNHVQNTNVHMK